MVSAVDETAATSTFAGFVRILRDSFTMLLGIVAEKNSDCRLAGS